MDQERHPYSGVAGATWEVTTLRRTLPFGEGSAPRTVLQAHQANRQAASQRPMRFGRRGRNARRDSSHRTDSTH